MTIDWRRRRRHRRCEQVRDRRDGPAECRTRCRVGTLEKLILWMFELRSESVRRRLRRGKRQFVACLICKAGRCPAESHAQFRDGCSGVGAESRGGASSFLIFMKESGAAAGAIMSNIRLDTVMFFVRRLVAGRRAWNAVESVGVMLNGEGPEARRDAGVVEESRCVLVDVATTTCLSNCVHYLVVWRRDLQSDAFVDIVGIR